MENNYFKKLNSIKCETDTKNNLTYVSWSDAWAEVKKEYPESNYTIYETTEWFPFWESKFGIDVKVWVTINGLEHIVRLPVMDWANKAMKAESYTYQVKDWKTKWMVDKEVKAATQFDINKAIQRAFAKWIAMHWIGLYVFRWEDLPEELPVEKPQFDDKAFEDFKKVEKYKDHFEAYKIIEAKYELNIEMRKRVKEYYDSKWVEMPTLDDWNPPF